MLGGAGQVFRAAPTPACAGRCVKFSRSPASPGCGPRNPPPRESQLVVGRVQRLPPRPVPSSAPTPSGPKQPRSARASLMLRNREAPDLQLPARRGRWMTESIKVERQSEPAPSRALGRARVVGGDRRRLMTSTPSIPCLARLCSQRDISRVPGPINLAAGPAGRETSWADRAGNGSRAREGPRARPRTRVMVEVGWAAEQWRR